VEETKEIDNTVSEKPVSRLRRMSTTKVQVEKKKKNDLPSAFKHDCVQGELDLSNRSKFSFH